MNSKRVTSARRASALRAFCTPCGDVSILTGCMRARARHRNPCDIEVVNTVMSLPKITVVTPSFNQGHYLEATFQSVIAQEYPNLEWFVVDGGSKDNSVELIKKYEKHFNWWVSEKDRNHPHALNKGYEKATGEIFCFV